MKKVILAGISLVVIAAAAVLAYRSISAQATGQVGVSGETAEILQAKVDAVKAAAAEPEHKGSEVEVTEPELESYVLFKLRDKLTVQLDSIKVQLAPGTIAADAQVTFTASSGKRNPALEALVGGTHSLYIRGKLQGEDGIGKYDTEEIRVDGIPVPKIIMTALFDRYVKPKYPDADPRAPFQLPWGIESISILAGKAKIGY